jgi:hypothetical protein
MSSDFSAVTYIFREPFQILAAATLEFHLKVLSGYAPLGYFLAFERVIIVGQYVVPHILPFAVTMLPAGFPYASLLRRCVVLEGRGDFFSQTVLVFGRRIQGSAGSGAAMALERAGLLGSVGSLSLTAS